MPTELLTTSLRQRWAAVFRALAFVLPEGEASLAQLERDDFLYAVVRALIDQYRAGARALHFAPEMKPLRRQGNDGRARHQACHFHCGWRLQ